MGFNQFYTAYEDLDKVIEPQAGGYGKILIYPIENVSILNIDTPLYSDWFSIGLKPGTNYFTANMIDPKRSLVEEQKEADDGSYMDITVTGVLPFESEQNHKMFDLMKYDKFLLVVPSNGPLVRLIGDLDNPATFSHKYDSGTGSKNYPGTALSWNWKSQDKPRLYNPEVIVLGGGGGGGIIVIAGGLSGV